MDKKLLNLIDGISREWASEQFQRERRELHNSLAQSLLAQGRVKVYPYGSLATGLSLKDNSLKVSDQSFLAANSHLNIC
ncbi:hypothetical protein ACLKA7_005834 [Drosophila subpalustris]